MKIRHGLVSNSSSSSYVCDVCGEEASGWDMSLSEAGMYECENGHVFCESHIGEQKSSFVKNLIEKNHHVLVELIDSDMDEDWEEGDERIFTKENVEEFTRLFESGEISEIDDIEDEDIAEIAEKFLEELGVDLSNDDDRYEMSWRKCPICTLRTVTDKQLALFCGITLGKSLDGVRSDIQKEFGTLLELEKGYEKVIKCE